MKDLLGVVDIRLVTIQLLIKKRLLRKHVLIVTVHSLSARLAMAKHLLGVLVTQHAPTSRNNPLFLQETLVLIVDRNWYCVSRGMVRILKRVQHFLSVAL